MYLNLNPALFADISSFMHRLDPRTKIITTVLYMLSVIFTTGLLELSLLGFICLSMVFASRIGVSYYWHGLKAFLIIIAITAVVQLLMTGGQAVVNWHFIHISREGISLAAYLSVRLVLIVLASQVLLMTTSYMALTDGLYRILQPLNIIKFPTAEVVMIMTIAIRFIPLLLEEAQNIRQAQIARGADFKSGSFRKRVNMQLSILVPLFNIVLQRADELAEAMESRGYYPGQKRTHLHELKMSGLDYTVIIIISIAAAAAILL